MRQHFDKNDQNCKNTGAHIEPLYNRKLAEMDSRDSAVVSKISLKSRFFRGD